MRKTIVALACVLSMLLSLSLNAQEDQDPFYLFENIPQAPEASSLGEYGDITNNPYNGKANVSIPLYAINFEGMQIPIQLSYDTGGVRVASEASWVGLNWSLSTNFGISRSVNGKDDFTEFSNSYGTGKTGFIHNDYGPFDSFGSPEMDIYDLRELHDSFDAATWGKKHIDTQPDVFDVSLFGKTYKF